MLILLFVLWFVLNGRITLEITLWGVFVVALIYFFLCKFTNFSLKKDKKFCRKFLLIIAYFGVLLKEIFVSNINIVKVILRPKKTPVPEIVHMYIDIKSDFIKTLLANSITLTPGTITVDLEGNHFVVYSLDRTMIDGFENSTLVKLARKIEG